jgi:nicotinate-nucleotide adenylyltransferase
MGDALRRVGLLGGTFDPIHLGHLRLAEDAVEQLGLDEVLFVPAPNPWRKAGRSISPVQHRLRMVQLAVAGNVRFTCSEVELRQAGPTYTADTLAALQAELGQDTALHFIMGADALLDLPHWHEPGRIIALARLAVAARQGAALPPFTQLERLVPGISAAIERIDMTPLPISSTQLRGLAASGRSLRYLVPDAVAGYIKEHALYRRDSQPASADV